MFAQKGAEARIKAATEDLNQMMVASDKGIPQDLLAKASCVIVVPNMKAGGFVVGAEYGKGFFSCRKTGRCRLVGAWLDQTDRRKIWLSDWRQRDRSDHACYEQEMAWSRMLSDKFQIGGEASAAAGPVGRSSSAMTDAEMHAEILSYSRSRGIFGGLDLSGSAVLQDEKANEELYGKASPIKKSWRHM